MPRMIDGLGYRIALVAAIAGALTGCSDNNTASGLSQNVLDQAARALVRGEDRISAAELSDLLITQREPLNLIDLRSRADFDAGHIESSGHAQTTDLVSEAGRAVLNPDERLVLISASGVEAGKAATLLRLTGIPAQALDGGYASWLAQMSGDAKPQAGDAEAAQALAKRKAVACRLEGDYVATAGLTVKAEPSTAAGGAGYMPPLQPAESEPQADPLGLGLGLGLGEGVAPAKPEPKRLRIREGC